MINSQGWIVCHRREVHKRLDWEPNVRSPLVWTRKPPWLRFCESVISNNVFMTAIRILLAYLSRWQHRPSSAHIVGKNREQLHLHSYTHKKSFLVLRRHDRFKPSFYHSHETMPWNHFERCRNAEVIFLLNETYAASWATWMHQWMFRIGWPMQSSVSCHTAKNNCRCLQHASNGVGQCEIRLCALNLTFTMSDTVEHLKMYTDCSDQLNSQSKNWSRPTSRKNIFGINIHARS